MTDDRSDLGGADEESAAEFPTVDPSEPSVTPAVDRPAPAAGPSDPRVAAAVDRLDELAAKDPAEHVEIYEQVHRDLQDALADAADEGSAAEADQPGDHNAVGG